MIVPTFARISIGSRQDLSGFLLPLLMLLTVAVTAGALAWSYVNDYIVIYGDSVSHLQIARQVVDNITPGASQLGTSWLPLLHVLELPLIWNDHLWHSGLAGGIVSTVAAWGSAFFAFRLAQELSGSKFAGFAAGLLLLSNPNLLYMQTTPMNESLFICTALGSAHYLVRWVKDSRDQDLVLTGLFGLLTAFNRYEGWALILAQALVVAIIAWRRGGWQASQGLGLAYASLAGLAPILWFIWNWVLFGSPFDFLTNPFSSRSNMDIAIQEAGISTLPTLHNLPAASKYYGFAVYEMMGPVVCLAAVAGALYLLWRLIRRQNEVNPLPLLSLAAPGIFLIYAIYDGVTAIWLPDLAPHLALNVRYGLYVLPLMLGLVAMLSRLPLGNLILGVIVAAQLALLAMGPSAAAFDEQRVNEEFCASRVEVLGTDRCIPFTAGPEYLRENYDGGHILISARLDWLIYESGLPIKELIHEGNRDLWREALQDPSAYARWIVMSGTQPGLTADAVLNALYDSPIVAEDYAKVFDSRGLTIYRRNDEVWPPPAVTGGSP
jgi:hypothetical protein